MEIDVVRDEMANTLSFIRHHLTEAGPGKQGVLYSDALGPWDNGMTILQHIEYVLEFHKRTKPKQKI